MRSSSAETSPTGMNNDIRIPLAQTVRLCQRTVATVHRFLS
jgi:hypothetical protein